MIRSAFAMQASPAEALLMSAKQQYQRNSTIPLRTYNVCLVKDLDMEDMAKRHKFLKNLFYSLRSPGEFAACRFTEPRDCFSYIVADPTLFVSLFNGGIKERLFKFYLMSQLPLKGRRTGLCVLCCHICYGRCPYYRATCCGVRYYSCESCTSYCNNLHYETPWNKVCSMMSAYSIRCMFCSKDLPTKTFNKCRNNI